MTNAIAVNTTTGNNSSNITAEMTTITSAVVDASTVRIARSVVQEILEQIRDKDAPPINEQKLPLSPSSTCTHDDDNSVHPSFVPLGHAPLVALCEAALRDDQDENTTTDRRTQGDAHHQRTLRHEQPIEEKKTEEHPTFDTKQSMLSPPSTPRLHLFGSEYARYSTQCRELRPTTVPSSRPPAHRRLRNHNKSTLPPHRYLSAAPAATQVGALLDICVAFHANDPPPTGYYRLDSTATIAPGFYLHVKQEPLWDKAAQRPCLTALVLSTVCPPGFSIARVGRHGPPASLGGLFLCLRRSREGNPLTGLVVLRPPTAVPDGYTVLERTFHHHPAVLPHSNAFLAVRQRLCSLEATAPQLQPHAYYATHNTWVPTAQLGRFHVLDRSTHALKSPSALTHRLQWLQQNQQLRTRCDSSGSWSAAAATSTYAESSGGGPSGDDTEDVHADDELQDFIPRVPLHPEISLLLHTILTACYTRHGGAAWVALQGLLRLWQTPMVEAWWWETDTDSHTAVSALDVATQAVCDIATCGASSLVFRNACVAACRCAVRTGRLGVRTLGFVIRCYWFVWLSDGPSTPSIAVENPASAALQELVTIVLRNEAMEQKRLAAAQAATIKGTGYLDGLMTHIVNQAVDTAVDTVDQAEWMQQVLHQIAKSGGSELFWHEMVYTCGQALWTSSFAGDNHSSPSAVVVAFAALESIVKVACTASQASKGLSLDLLLHWLRTCSAKDEKLVYAVRRTVVPCLLSNTQACLEHPHVLRRILRIMTALWTKPAYRNECKIEIGLLLDHFVLLLLGNQSLDAASNRVAHQVHIMEEIELWFSDDPTAALQMFLNYDADGESQPSASLPPGPRWNVLQRLVLGLSSVAERCGESITRQIEENQTLILDPSHSSDGRKDAQAKAGKRESDRTMRKASLQTLRVITEGLAISAGGTAGIEFSSLLLSWFPDSGSSTLAQMSGLPVTVTTSAHPDCDIPSLSADEAEVLNFWRREQPGKEPCRNTPEKTQHKSSQGSLQVAFAIADTKSVKKAVEYLIACNVLAPTPRDIANFVQVHKERFNSSSLGEYLSESGSGAAESDFWSSLRYHFIRSISFIGMTVESGFRHFIANAGFHLPGEAQKVDRILASFTRCYFEDNAGDTTHCPFQDEDTVYMLVFALVMLNTDLHKNGASSGRKTPKKMTKVEFVNNLKVAVQHDVLPRNYVSTAYDSISTRPIQLLPEKSSKKNAEGTCMSDNAAPADAMLRGLAVRQCKFSSVFNLKGQELSDMERLCFGKVWHNLHGVVNTCLECAHLDSEGLEPAIDILLYGLVITVCLDMRLERSAFLSQFVRLCLFGEKIRGRIDSDYSMRVKQLRWFDELEELCSGPTQHKIEVLRKTKAWVGKLKSSLRVDIQNKSEMSKVVADLKQGEFLLNDPARAFLQSGNLIKRSNKTGRSVEYRFFLFSDLLLYASKQDSGRYKIHEELPLHFMKIVDWFPVTQRGRHLMFQVHHPRKSFVVVCPTPESRRSWVEDIRGAIMVEMERKMVVEAARASTH